MAPGQNMHKTFQRNYFLRLHLGELSADDREECLQIIQPMGRRCKMVDHVAKGKFFVVAQQTKSGGSACLPNLVEKEHKIKKKLTKKVMEATSLISTRYSRPIRAPPLLL